jgi:hypothetical protein
VAQLTLSQAIREGAKLRPQAFSLYFQHQKDGTVCSCALGAAAEAVLGITDIQKTDGEDIYDHFPELASAKQVTTPNKTTTFLRDAIVYLNDQMRWTREQIADWVETIENQVSSNG